MRNCLSSLLLIGSVAFLGPAGLADDVADQGHDGSRIDSAGFNTEAFRCVIGNNAVWKKHNSGFNGIWSLIPKGSNDNFIAEGLAGLNLEHYFNGRDEDVSKPELLFDPRYSPMEFKQTSEYQCTLYQPPTKHFAVESWTEFTVSEPHYVDMSFRCIPRREVFPFDWLGVFWATYAPRPEDTSIYFLAYETAEQKEPEWFKSAGGMYYGRNAKVPLRFEGPMKNHMMSKAAPVRWAEPFYYGVWRGHAYIVMFDTQHDLAMYAGQSPLGWNPWDFQMIVHEPKVGSEYRLRTRMVFDQFKGRDWVLDEYKKWQSQKPQPAAGK